MKKITQLLFTLLLALILVACGNDEVNVDYDEIINAVTISDIDLGSITGDFVLPDKMDGYNLVWISNNEAITIKSFVASVTQKDSDTTGTINVSIKDNETFSKSFNVTVKAKAFVLTKEEIINQIKINLHVGETCSSVKSDITLTLKVDDIDIYWTSAKSSVIKIDGNKGIVTRHKTNETVVLTASFIFDGQTHHKEITVVVKMIDEEDPIDSETPEINLNDILDSLLITLASGDTLNSVTKDFELTTKSFDYPITWASSDTSTVAISNGKAIVTRNDDEVSVTLTASFMFNGKVETKEFTITVLKEEIDEPEVPVEPARETTYFETFETLQEVKDSGNNSSAYDDYDFIGDNPNVLWEFNRTRIDLLYNNTNAVTVHGGNSDGGPELLGGLYIFLNEGISKLSFDIKLPYYETDKHTKVTIFFNDIKINEYALSGKDNQRISIDNLNFKGEGVLRIIVSSGHRVTFDNFSWTTNLFGQEVNSLLVDFESSVKDDDQFTFLNQPTEIQLSGMVFIGKEIQVSEKDLHPQNESSYLTDSLGTNMARFRGNGSTSSSIDSTPIAYLYNKDPFSHVTKLTFTAKLFNIYSDGAEIHIYYDISGEWVLLTKITSLTTDFMYYEIDVNLENVRIKIEVPQVAQNNTINIDNINFIFQ